MGGGPGRTTTGGGRSFHASQQLTIRWETITALPSRDRAVVTGAEAGPDRAGETPAAATRPLCVLVCNEDIDCPILEKLEDMVFPHEKVALGLKAFRTLRIAGDYANEDPLLEDAGRTVPRVVLFDPTHEKVKVLEGKSITASRLYAALKSVAAGFYEEKIDRIVKTHLKLLAELDKMAQVERTLNNKLEQIDDPESTKGRKVKEELEALARERDDLLRAQADAWKLTPREA